MSRIEKIARWNGEAGNRSGVAIGLATAVDFSSGTVARKNWVEYPWRRFSKAAVSSDATLGGKVLRALIKGAESVGERVAELISCNLTLSHVPSILNFRKYLHPLSSS